MNLTGKPMMEDAARNRGAAIVANRRRFIARQHAGTPVVDDRGNVFPKLKFAAEKHGVTKAAIAYAIRHGTRCSGLRWRYVADVEQVAA